MLKFIFSSALLFIGISIFAQDAFPPSLIKENKVELIETYIYFSEEKPKVKLASKESFNQSGYRIEIERYKSDGTSAQWKYIYKNDSLLTISNYYVDYELKNFSKYSYDLKANLIGEALFNPDGQAAGFYTEMKYSKKNNLLESKAYKNNTLIEHSKYKYHSNGKIKEQNILLPESLKGKTKFNKEGMPLNSKNAPMKTSTSRQENYNDGGLLLIETKTQYKQITSILGFDNNSIELKPHDEYKIQKFISLDGLLFEEKEFLNGDFWARKKYVYLKK